MRSIFSHTKAQRHKGYKVILIALLFIILLIGCDLNSNETGDLNGTWVSEYDETFIINLSSNSFIYDDIYSSGYNGIIQEITYFNNNSTAGIIFIKYTDKPYYYGTENQPEGDYIGIYFKELTKTQAAFAPPFTEEDWIPAKITLNEAKLTFTVDRVSDFVTYWSVCEKK